MVQYPESPEYPMKHMQTYPDSLLSQCPSIPFWAAFQRPQYPSLALIAPLPFVVHALLPSSHSSSLFHIPPPHNSPRPPQSRASLTGP
jgi:hypothetical protein